MTGFVVLLVVTMGFYGLGLLLGRGDSERTVGMVSPPPMPAGKPKINAPDPRSELDFINAVAGKKGSKAILSDLPARDVVAGRLYESNAGLTDPQTSPRKFFSVQVAAFEKEQKAQQLSHELVKQGYSARVVREPKGSEFQVYVGRYADRSQAETMARQLNKMRLSASTKVVVQ